MKKSSRRFKSHYSNDLVTDGQYITEMFCELFAKRDHKELPSYYWRQEMWKKTYARIIKSVYKLLRKYKTSSMISALGDWRCKNIKGPFDKQFLYVLTAYENNHVDKSEKDGSGISGETRKPLEKTNILSKL